jgi:hypothetical protein
MGGMSTLILVGKIVQSTRATATVWAVGREHELRWACPPMGELVRMVVTPDDLVLVEAKDGELRRFELILSPPAGTGAVVELEEPAPSLRPGVCGQCHEAGWVVEGPEPLEPDEELGRLIVLPAPLGGDAA